MSGDILDVVLALLVVGSAIQGARRGLIVGAASLAGFVGGAILGTRLVPVIVQTFTTTPRSAGMAAIATVIVAAIAVEAGAAMAAVALRRRLRWSVLRRFDAAGGAVLSVMALLVVAWVVALAAVRSPIGGLTRQFQNSLILRGVNAAVPGEAYTTFANFLSSVQPHDMPPLFNGLSGLVEGGLKPVPPPPDSVLSSTVLADGEPSVLKIQADQPQCGRGSEGSGFVLSANHVVTNAHVVAGARSVRIEQDGTGAALNLPATVVLYDPNVDLAVLYVPGLHRQPLHWASSLGPAGLAAVVGFPENGAFTVNNARLRGEMRATGPNIYNSKSVTRDVYVLRATVRPGNSGGPLLTPAGDVAGIVFAASTTGDQTGYALTTGQVRAEAETAAGATGKVGTQGCD